MNTVQKLLTILLAIGVFAGGLLVFGFMQLSSRPTKKVVTEAHDHEIARTYYKMGWYHGNIHSNEDSIIVDYCFKSDSIDIDSQFKTK